MRASIGHVLGVTHDVIFNDARIPKRTKDRALGSAPFPNTFPSFTETMSLHVICSGCLKRFQVGVRFAGMKGPCPNCGTVISIPTESLKLPDADDAKSGKEKGQDFSRSAISRVDWKFDPILARGYALGVLGVMLLAFLLGCIPMYDLLRTLMGTLGLCLIAFPLTLFGYQAVRDREQIFAFTGEELYRRTGMTAAGYVILWIALEYFLAATRADVVFSWLYFAAFAGLASLMAMPILAMRMQDALSHYCMFGFSVILFRYLIGLGWFWQSSALIRHSAAPPPPLLPGM